LILGYAINPCSKIFDLVPFQVLEHLFKHLHHHVFGLVLIAHVFETDPEKHVRMTLKKVSDIGIIIGIPIAFNEFAVAPILPIIRI
jgi:hypothetical protein